jgi:hypothetical protein
VKVIVRGEDMAPMKEPIMPSKTYSEEISISLDWENMFCLQKF